MAVGGRPLNTALEVMDSALPAIIVSAILCVLTYGVVAAGLGYVLATGRLRGASAIAIYVVSLVALAVPCMFVARGVARLIPIVWGHAGEMFFFPYVGSSIIIFGAALTVYVLKGDSGESGTS